MSVRFLQERNAYGEERKELQASLEEASSAKENELEELTKLRAVRTVALYAHVEGSALTVGCGREKKNWCSIKCLH